MRRRPSSMGPPPALRSQAPQGTTAEARLGALIRHMEVPEGLDAAADNAILRQLRRADAGQEPRGRDHRRAWARRMLVLPALVAAIAVGTMYLGIAAQAAISWVRRVELPWSHKSPAAARPPDARAPLRHTGVAQRAMTPALTTDEVDVKPEVMPPETPPASASGAPSRSLQRSQLRAGASAAEATLAPPAAEATLAPPAPEPPSALAQESRLLGTALAALRTDRDYAGALATLDEYDARFPTGALRNEAAFARLDALMALGQSAAALRLLDEREQGRGRERDGPRAAEMLVVRGELRAGAGRYQDAIEDFERALGLAAGSSLKERALYGRLSCRERAGDTAGASQDQQDYLSTFPGGPHAAELRRRKPGP